MKISQKKNCNDCKALEFNRCILGYKITREWICEPLLSRYRPNEPCPKPKTNKELIESMGSDIG
jgi:hypothetical protein